MDLKKQPSVKEQSEKTIPKKVLKFFREMRDDIRENDIGGIGGWKEKMRIARNMRQGIKRVTDFPYPGAPDIPLQESDKMIRKLKPRFVLAVTSGKRYMKVSPQEGIQNVTPELKQKGEKANLAMNWIFHRPQMDWVRKLTLAADRFLEKGHSIFKVTEKFNARMVNRVVALNEYNAEELAYVKELPKAEKVEFLANRYGLDPDNDIDKRTLDTIISEFAQGKEVIRFTTEEVTSLPNVSLPLPEKVFVPLGTIDIEHSTRITNEFFWTKEKLMDLALNNTLIKDKVFKIIKREGKNLQGGDDDMNEKIKSRLEGVEDVESTGSLYKIHETVTWYQPSAEKPYERWVFTYFAEIDDPEEAIIQYIPYPFETAGWNYVKHDNEIVDDRYYSSRGIPEQIRSVQEFMEKSLNNMLIRDEINNAPMFTVLNSSPLSSDNMRFIPGQKINVNQHEEIKELNKAAVPDLSSERIMQYLKAFGEEYIGITDQLFRNATNKGGGKTLGEVQMGVGEAQFSSNLDVKLFINTIRQVYEKVFSVFRERLTTPLVINGTTITREDFDFIPDIAVNGSLEMADKTLQAQRAQMRLERVVNALNLGIATKDDVFRGFEDFFEKDGVKEPLDFLTDPNEIAKQNITMLENQIAQLNQIFQDQQSEIAQGDNTLRQINQQISRKGGSTNAKPKTERQ